MTKNEKVLIWLSIFNCLVCILNLYIFATKNEITLKTEKWNCTASLIINNVAVCSEYKLKETK